MVKLSVPATTANLGPGFDCMGCAVSLRATLTFSLSDRTRVTGCPAAYAHADNLALRALRFALMRAGLELPPVALDIRSPIPPARGLGSSAALIVAGVAAAGLLAGRPFSGEDVLNWAAAMEGHPDNAAPALYGGLRLSFMEGERAVSLLAPVHPSLRFLALVPNFPLPTEKARAALPDKVARTDAVHNIGRAAALVKALEAGDMALLTLCLKDRLHQPYRFPLIAGADAVQRAARSLGCGTLFLSGAGPTLMCIYQDKAFSAAMEEQVRAIPGGWQALPLQVDKKGLTVISEDE